MQFYRLKLSNGHIRYIEATSYINAYVKGLKLAGMDILSVINAKDYFYHVVLNA